ncbi:MAG: COX15/CtaA family protein, partial [bacterium]|nr:COX15/CtaA family protein [bacterium]
MNAFQKTAITTVIAVLILIAVGSLVRVSGAGLGCPDWPRCWGCWLPPSGPGEIDPAYLAERGLDIKDFNPVKMWIEYTNRMVGVTIGLLVFATFLRALPYRKTRPEIFWGSLAAVLLVGFEGWLGGQVVRSGLKPGMITLHMVGAVVLLCVL